MKISKDVKDYLQFVGEVCGFIFALLLTLAIVIRIFFWILPT